MTQLPAAWLHRPQGPSWLQVQVEDAQVEDARLPDPVPTFASLRRVTQPGASPAPTAAEAEASVVSNEPQLENSSAPGAPGQRGAWARHSTGSRGHVLHMQQLWKRPSAWRRQSHLPKTSSAQQRRVVALPRRT